MKAHDVISMPDAWEYPWFAAWDLAFHCGALALVDVDFAKDQIELMLSERYFHPNGQIPAYEWNFSDVNPPVHALAACTSKKATARSPSITSRACSGLNPTPTSAGSEVAALM
jgi:hypothetical protein